MSSRSASRRLPGRPRALALAIHLLLAGAATLAVAPSALAAEQGAPARKNYDIASGSLGDVLARFAGQAGVRLSFDPAWVSGQRSAGLRGSYSVDEGFAHLLAGSGYALNALGDSMYSLRKQPAANAGAQIQLAEITVTGQGERPGSLPKPYAGGQVARGARLGVLGNVDIMDAPFNVTAYTAQTIVDQQSATVAEVLRNDPSVRYTTSDGHNAENFTIRGFEVNSAELAFNGMYGMLPGAHVPTEFLERVEVFKGPAAMLSGIAPSGSVGGVINLVPKRASAEPLTRLSASYASDSRLGLAADIGRRFGENDRWGVRLNASASEGDTALDDQTKRERFAALALDYRGERWRLEMDAYLARQNQSNGSPLMVGFSTLGRVLDAPDPSKNALRGTYARQDSEGAAVRGEFDFHPQWTAYAALGAARYQYDGYLNGTRVVALTGNGNSRGQTYNQEGYSRSVTAEAGVHGAFSTGNLAHKLNASMSLLRTRNGLASPMTSASYTTNLYDPLRTPSLAGAHGAASPTADNVYTSLALSDTVSMLDDALLLTVGARAQRVRQKMATPKAYDETAITPLLGVVVKPWGPSLSLYGNYIEGLSPGITVSTIYANAGETLAPYQTRQAELGVKWDSGAFTHTLSVFDIEKPFTVTSSGSGSALPRLTLDGEQQNRGMEWNMFGQLGHDVRLLGGAAYVRAKQTRASTASTVGRDAPGTPRWTANLGAEWDAPWLPGLTLNARAIYTGAQYLDAASALQIPAWTRWDVGARYAMRLAGHPATVRASVENLADRHYWSGRFGEGFATLGAPRAFKLSMSVDF